MEEYSYKNHSLKMIDEELKLDHQENFSPIRIPEDLRNNSALKDDHVLRIHKNSDGGFEYAVYKNNEFSGEYQLTYPSGKIKLHCFYNWGKLHGPSTFYAEDGEILTLSWFLQGKQTGKCRWYYHSQELYSVQRYIDNQWHGKQEYWYENGVLKTLMEYSRGEIDGMVKLYFPNGKVKRELEFSKGTFIKESSIYRS
jgi:antitoxin component YwqK of YwqJK toxin-antitoxin module